MSNKIVACGDIHVRETVPGMRTEEDFFEEVCVPKLEWIVNFANENDAIVAIAGDIYDHASTRYELTHRVSRILQRVRLGVLAVPGQHDMNYHSQKMMDTPYQTLVETKAIINTHGTIREEGTLRFHGAGFGIEPTLHADVLITHCCITEKDPPFFLKEGISALDYLLAYPRYRLIISGDYHVSHVTELEGRVLVNCGPMYRKEKTQLFLKPCVYLIEVDDDDICCEQVYIPVRPHTEAFDLAKIEKSKSMGLSQDIDTSALKEMLLNDEQTTVEFPDVVSLVCAQYSKDNNVTIPMQRLESILHRARA